jgi:hypothetical protein
MNSIRMLIFIFFLYAVPLMMIGQENRNKRTFKTFSSFKARKTKSNFEVPQMESVPPATIADKALDDSLAKEYQQWLRMEPKRITMQDNISGQYIKPDLRSLNPEKKSPPKVTYHYDINSVRAENRMYAPPKGLVTFDAAQLLNKDARDRARDLKHKERAKKILDQY